MPTREQMETTVAHIEDVTSRGYVEGDGDQCSCWFQPEGGGALGMGYFRGVPVGTPEPFGNLPDKAKVELLVTYVGWEGFDDAQVGRVIGRVVGGEGPDAWLLGIESGEGRPGKPGSLGRYENRLREATQDALSRMQGEAREPER